MLQPSKTAGCCDASGILLDSLPAAPQLSLPCFFSYTKKKITGKMVHSGSFSLPCNHVFPVATRHSVLPQTHGVSAVIRSTRASWPGLLESLLPSLTTMIRDPFLSSKRNHAFLPLMRERPSILSGVCGARFPSTRELLTFQLLHGRERDAQQQEGRETAERHMGIYKNH